MAFLTTIIHPSLFASEPPSRYKHEGCLRGDLALRICRSLRIVPVRFLLGVFLATKLPQADAPSGTHGFSSDTESNPSQPGIRTELPLGISRYSGRGTVARINLRTSSGSKSVASVLSAQLTISDESKDIIYIHTLAKIFMAGVFLRNR